MAEAAPTKTNEQTKTLTTNNNISEIPDWINEDNFLSVLEDNVADFSKILNFEVKETGGGGENYASMMMRVKVKVELKDASTKDVAFMIKTIPQGEHGAELVSMMGLFPKETSMYGLYLRNFEEMYRSVGKQITFGPKFYQLKNDPGIEYVLLEDLSPRGFKNLNRLDGLDEEHTKSVLKMLAELHAVSAVHYEEKEAYEESFMKSPFKEENRENLDNLMKPLVELLSICYAKHEIGAKYLPRLQIMFENLTEKYIEDSKVNFNEFNVVIHGDLWSNNIMFQHNDEGKLQQTIFIDFQLCRYASPVVDLFYFLLSSPKLDMKLKFFDEFVKFYHDNLVENLKLLNYPKKLPTVKDLRMSLLKRSSWAISTLTGILAAILLDPSENANMDNFFQQNEEAKDFRKQLYENPRYIQHLELILPWMDKMGYLDES